MTFSTAHNFHYGLYIQHTAGSVTRFLWWDWDRQRGREWCCELSPPRCHISVETANSRYVSCFCLTALLPGTWPLTHTQTQHIHKHSMCAQTRTHAHTHCSTRCVFTWVMSWSWVIELIQRVYRSVDPSGILWTLQPISYHETTHIWAWQIFSFQEWLKTLAEILEKCCRRCN